MPTTVANKHMKTLVRETVIETLLALGVNISEPDEVVQFQQDMSYLRKERVRKEAIENKAWSYFVKMVLASIVAGLVSLVIGHRPNL